MKFKRLIKQEYGLEQINMAPLIDMIFLLLIFFLLTSSFTIQSAISVKLPNAVTSDTIKDENMIVTISSEDVLYLNGEVIRLSELEKKLTEYATLGRPILIKSDRRASMGRIVDLWDLCRKLNIEQVNIATNRDN